MSTPANTFLNPTRVLFGIGISERLESEAAALRMQKIFFVTDPGLAAGENCQRVTNKLRSAGFEVTLFNEVVPDPTAESVERAFAQFKTSGCDSIVAFGGGSSMDTAKAVGVLANGEGGSILAYAFGGSLTPQGVPPLICIPTTAGTGSEVTFIAIVTSNGAKQIVRHPSIAPTLALVDPALTVGMPLKLTAATALDAAAHALEALTSTMSGVESDELALSAFSRIAQALPAVARNGADLAARSEMSIAATEAGIAFLNGRVHLGHAVGHSLGTVFKIPHGFACAACLPAILRFLDPVAGPALESMSARLGGRAPADVLEALMVQVGAPRLGEATGCTSKDIPRLIEIVESTEQRLIGLSRRRPSQADWEQIFASSF